MDRETEATLLVFCAAPHQAFDSDQWLAIDRLSQSELAATALFLAGRDWLGHEETLQCVAECLGPGDVGRFSDLARQTRFDCSRFKSRLLREMRSLSRQEVCVAVPSH